MSNAEVGDNVIDVDPTVAQLEARTAELLGKEAAIFMPSGTMTNQIAIRLHCRPGDEFLCEEGCHIYNYEQGAYAQLSGVAARPIIGQYGALTLDHLVGTIRADNEHMAQTRLLCLENTHNRAGGTVLPYESIEATCTWARQAGLATHLDGARLFNAVMATGIDAQIWARHFDTVSVCFSKGLGAPVGSALAGTREVIQTAVRHRKLFGGGMRQAGIIAAGALYALDHNIPRLVEDHTKARLIGETVEATPSLQLRCPAIDTNIVAIQIDTRYGSAGDFLERLETQGVRMLAMTHDCIRAVTHCDVSMEQTQQACSILQIVAEEFAASPAVGS